MTQIREPGPALSEAKMAKLERDLRVELPDVYRRFLLAHNGGRPSPRTVNVPGLPGGATDVSTFFGIGRAVETSGLEWNKQKYAERIPKELLPVACDPGGGIFALGLSGEVKGQVFFCDINGWFNVEPRRKPYLVAPDFDAFLARLREFEEVSA